MAAKLPGFSPVGSLEPLQPEQLFTAICPGRAAPAAPLHADGLEAFLTEVARHRRAPRPTAAPVSLNQLSTFLNEIKVPFQAMYERGGRLNPWSAAGIGKRETRVSATLAALWREDFAGATSRQFLANWLGDAFPEANAEYWDAELRSGYSVHTEECPLDERYDRVDIIVVTQRHLIAVEIKINAGLGPRQLERYRVAMDAWAKGMGKTAHVVLLARYLSQHDGVSSRDWHSVARSADAAVRMASGPYSQLIGFFGRHVETF